MKPLTLIPHAPVWYRLWSIRLALIAALFGVAEQVLPLWTELIPANLFATLSTIAAVGSAVSRVVQQTTLPPVAVSDAPEQ